MQLIVVATFYKFISLPDYRQLQPLYKHFMLEHGIKGTILLASEGINATISGTRESIDAILNKLRADSRFTDMEHKESIYTRQPFKRAKVRLKKEILALGQPTFPHQQVGSYVLPAEWNQIVDDPETILIDARNAYEIHLGRFKGAINAGIRHFKELPQFAYNHLRSAKGKKIAMYCTGGIRCEKFSSYLLQLGFENVYHLKGGILKYLEEMPADQSRWEGSCFVFDERIAVEHGLTPATASMCSACGHPINAQDRRHPDYCEGKRCGWCKEYKRAA